MAISQTMSNTTDWIFQPYQNDFSHSEISPPNSFAASTTTSATTTTVSRNNNLSPEQGRVSKPIRRRSRASRRTPTTLLNTDTTNFRAMVQHFTGGPAATFGARPQAAPTRVGGALGYMGHPNGAAGAAPASGFHVQYPSQLQQQHMFMIENMHGGGGGGGQAAPVNQNRGYDNFMM